MPGHGLGPPLRADHRLNDPATSTKRAVDRLDDRERRLSFAAAVAAFVLGVVDLRARRPTTRTSDWTRGQLTPQTTLVLGIACGVLLLGATYIGRRAPVGFVALFTFLDLRHPSFVLGLPFLALAVWLLYRSYKIQKEATAKLRAERADAASTSSGTSREARGGTARTSRPDQGARPPRPAAKGGRPGPRPTSATPPSARRRRHPNPPAGNARRPRPPTEPDRTAARSAVSASRLGDQRRAQQFEDLVPPAHQGPGRGLLTEGPQHLDLGEHADHRGVDGQQQQPGLVPPHVPGVHLRLEELGGPPDQRLEGGRPDGWRPACPVGPSRAPGPAARAGGRPAGTPSAPPPRPGTTRCRPRPTTPPGRPTARRRCGR